MQENERQCNLMEYEKEREKSERIHLQKHLTELGFDYLGLYDYKNLEENKKYYNEKKEFLRELRIKIDNCKISDKEQKYREMLCGIIDRRIKKEDKSNSKSKNIYQDKYILNAVLEYLLQEYDTKLIDEKINFSPYDVLMIEKFRSFTTINIFNKSNGDEIRNYLDRLELSEKDAYIKERLKIEIICILLKLVSCSLYNISIKKDISRNSMKEKYNKFYEKLKNSYSEELIKEYRIKNRFSLEKEFSLFLLQKIREKPNFYQNKYKIKEVYKKVVVEKEFNIYNKILKNEEITDYEIKILLLYIREELEKSEIRNFKNRVTLIKEFVKEMEKFNSSPPIHKIDIFKSVYSVLYIEKEVYDRKSNYKLVKEILKNKDLEFIFLNQIKNLNTVEIQKNKSLQNKVTEYAAHLTNAIMNTTELYYSTEKELEEIIELDKIKVEVLKYILKLPDRRDVIEKLCEIFETVFKFCVNTKNFI